MMLKTEEDGLVVSMIKTDSLQRDEPQFQPGLVPLFYAHHSRRDRKTGAGFLELCARGGV